MSGPTPERFAILTGSFPYSLVRAALVALGAAFIFLPSAAADPTAPVVVTQPPDDQGEAFVPGMRLVADLPQAYVEEEFFVEGTASLFSYRNNPPVGPADLVEIDANVPYKTRLFVRRPVDPLKFNGTVIVEWWNSTVGFDTAPVWDASAEYFAREGIVYVGVTNANQALAYLLGGCRPLGTLPPSCGTRYVTLSLPDDGLAYEMMSQIANTLQSHGLQGLLPHDYPVKRLFHAGQSQQAGSIITYASVFHLDGINDGYFIQSGINARQINGGPICGDEDTPQFPGCTPSLVFPDTLVRSDLPVPVYQLITQSDFEALGFNVFGRQPDTDTYRYYEVAGGGHNTVHVDIEAVPAGIYGPDPIFLEDLCANELNTTADGPVFVNNVLNALWERMQDQVRFDHRPPPGVLMDDVNGRLVRDAFANVSGGVRLPSLEVPVATYGSKNFAAPTLPPALDQFGALTCFLNGSMYPFPDEQLDELYPRRFSYILDVYFSVLDVMLEGLLLREDAVKILQAAVMADVGNADGRPK